MVRVVTKKNRDEQVPWIEDLSGSARDTKGAKEKAPIPEAKKAAASRRVRSEAPEEEPIKLPANNAVLADLWFDLRAQRLAMQAQVDALEKKEKYCKAALIDRIPKSLATGIAGKTVRVTIVKKQKARVADWEAFYKHVKKTGDFGLLNKALNTSHVEELWEHKKQVPGVEPFPVVDISYTKL